MAVPYKTWTRFYLVDFISNFPFLLLRWSSCRNWFLDPKSCAMVNCCYMIYMQSGFLGKSYRNSTPAKPCAPGFWQKSSPSKRERLRKWTENYPRHWVNPRWWCVHCVEKYPRQLLHDATSTETNFRLVFLFCRFGWLAGCNFKVYVKQIMQTNVFSAWKWLEDYFPLFLGGYYVEIIFCTRSVPPSSLACRLETCGWPYKQPSKAIRLRFGRRKLSTLIWELGVLKYQIIPYHIQHHIGIQTANKSLSLYK